MDGGAAPRAIFHNCGLRADLIILDANPLESIHNIRTVKFVITNGAMYNCGELWSSVGFKP